MVNGFIKDSFTSDLGYKITHTRGQSAEDSTISYLHQSSNFIIYYFIKGSGNIKIEGKNYNINDGDIIFLNTQEMFCCRIDADKYHERIVIHLSDGILKNFPKECGELLSPFISREKGDKNIIDAETVINYNLHRLIEDALFFAKKGGNKNEILSLCKITEFLHFLAEATENKKVIKTTQNPTVNKVLSFLNNNFTNQITIDDISKEFNLDKSYLSHLFKEYVGTSIWNYVIFRRISHFNNLVRTGVCIEDASHKAGFNNYSNFFRLYKKHTGITPSEYKYKKSPQ